MKRIDALDETYRTRLQGLRGKVLDPELDQSLQSMVDELARELDMPIALISLVLERTQFFRAHVGLPPDLAVARATDRDVSFCQFVVRDGHRFEVTDAAADGRVPQDLVERYGVRAYVGEPLSIVGEVVGSLCAIDVKPREFSDTDRRRIAALAARVSARLEELALIAAEPSHAALSAASVPAFAEVRNLMAPLGTNVGAARVALADIGPFVRIVEELSKQEPDRFAAFGSLLHARIAFDDLAEIVGDMDECVRRLTPTVLALEKLLLRARATCLVPEVVEAASHLAHHHTKLVGGVAWDPVPPWTVLAPRSVAISTLASALSLLADAADSSSRAPLRGSFARGASQVVIEVGSPELDGRVAAECATSVRRVLGDSDWVSVGSSGGHVQLCFAAGSERAPAAS